MGLQTVVAELVLSRLMPNLHGNKGYELNLQKIYEPYMSKVGSEAVDRRFRACVGKALHVLALDRKLHSLFACVLFLSILFLWKLTYSRSCLALAVLPTVTCLTMFYGVLECRLERKRFVLDYYLDHRSSWRRWFRRSWLSVLISLATAVPLTVFLVVFVARSRPADWLFLCAATWVAPLLFNALWAWSGHHLRRDVEGSRRVAVADILVVRMAGLLLSIALAGAYLYTSYYLIPMPGQNIFPASLERTVEAFSTQRARSACLIVDDALHLSTQLEGMSWHLITTAETSTWLHDTVKFFLWAVFFLNATMVFFGFIRGLEGSILLAVRVVKWRQKE